MKKSSPNKENNYKNMDVIFTFDRILLYQLENAFFVVDHKESKKGIF